MEKKIIWQKWRDPLGVIDTDAGKPAEIEEDSEYLAASNSFEDDRPSYRRRKFKKGMTGPAIIGPMGIIPVHEENMPSKLYNFWMGHTNFDLDEKAVGTIELVPGVETLDVFTRYRFRIGFGKGFNAPLVRKAVEDAVCVNIHDILGGKK